MQVRILSPHEDTVRVMAAMQRITVPKLVNILIGEALAARKKKNPRSTATTEGAR